VLETGQRVHNLTNRRSAATILTEEVIMTHFLLSGKWGTVTTTTLIISTLQRGAVPIFHGVVHPREVVVKMVLCGDTSLLLSEPEKE